ncbi:MAG TPA: class I SAM-dependent methyltransferase [Ktedonobacteraceae bacterium]|jgi:ubiquinone/menaquinone biosynthesis C-methylase UbiE|nr:class I SAM-dependent methyltransferase [Ktedonobacteraceae bacterium]
MTQPTPAPQNKGEASYFIDPENAAEMGRLLNQDQLVTEEMGGLFPERSNDFSGIQRILDLGCGPGGWAQEVAFAHPDIEVVGVDISQAMIDYANMQAQVQGLDNAHFRVMDITQPLDFPDHTFDMVTARFITFLPRAAWSHLMQECKRITRPGGIVRLTEQEWWCFSTSAALEKMNEMICQFIKMQGGFSQTGRFTGVLPTLKSLVEEAGCKDVRLVPHVIDYSAGTKAHFGFAKDAQVLFQLFQPAIVHAGITTKQEIEQLYEQMQFDMMQDDFRGIWLLLTAWGEKQ